MKAPPGYDWVWITTWGDKRSSERGSLCRSSNAYGYTFGGK